MVHSACDVCLGWKITPIMHVMSVSAGRCDSEFLTHSPGSLSKGTPLQLTTRTSWLFCFGFCNRRRRCHDLATDEEFPPPEGAEKSKSS